MTFQRLSEKPSKSETVSDRVSRGGLAFLTKTPASEHTEAGWKISEGSGWRYSLTDREGGWEQVPSLLAQLRREGPGISVSWRSCLVPEVPRAAALPRWPGSWLSAARSILWQWGLQLHTPHFWWGPHGHLRLHHRHLKDEDRQGSSSTASMRLPSWRHGRGLPQDAGATVQGNDQDLLQPHRQLTLWKKVIIFIVPSRDVTDQTLSGRE